MLRKKKKVIKKLAGPASNKMPVFTFDISTFLTNDSVNNTLLSFASHARYKSITDNCTFVQSGIAKRLKC
jgi:hypothetical protein